jgi:hypothetical protein
MKICGLIGMSDQARPRMPGNSMLKMHETPLREENLNSRKN